MSATGNIVAVGARGNDNAGTDAGQVRVYEYRYGNWVQLGAAIDGEAAGHRFGSSVSLSEDGTTGTPRLAVGAPTGGCCSNGQVRVFDYVGGAWVQLGGDITREANQRNEHNYFGYDVALSRDGRSIVTGAYYFAFSARLTKTGAVYVYRLDESVAPPQWVQFGADYQGESNRAYFDRLGVSVAISQDGASIAAGVLLVYDPHEPTHAHDDPTPRIALR